MSKAKDKLNPCACGSKRITVAKGQGSKGWYAVCQSCGKTLAPGVFRQVDLARAWNSQP